MLLGLAWVILRGWRRLPDHAHEALWRVALFGGFLTAGLQLSLGLGPDLGGLGLSVGSAMGRGGSSYAASTA